jgi:hypothetical protein
MHRRPEAKRYRRLLVLGAITFYSVLLFLVTYGVRVIGRDGMPAFVRADEYSISDDFAQGIVWASRGKADAGFVEQDITLHVSKELRPEGYRLTYQALSQVADPLTVSRLLPLPLLAGSVILLFVFLRRELGTTVAVIGTLIMPTTSVILDSMGGGHERAFTGPLLLAVLVCLVQERYKLGAIVVLLGAILYPPVFLVTGGISLVYLMIESKLRIRQVLRPVVYLLVAIAVGSTVAGIKSHRLRHDPLIGPMYSKAEVVAMPQFGSEGRVQIASNLSQPTLLAVSRELTNWFVPIISDLPAPHRLRPTVSKLKSLCSKAVAFSAFAVWLLALVRRRSLTSMDTVLISMLTVGVTLYGLAHWLYPLFYIPSRYWPHLFSSLLLLRLLAEAPARFQRAAVYSSFALMPLLLFIATTNHSLVNYGRLANVYEAVKTTRHELIAAHPTTCDQIPTFARRSCLVNREVSGHALFFKHYWPEIKQRTDAFFAAYYASDPQPILNLANDYAVGYLLLDLEDFTAEGNRYFEPFQSMIGERKRASRGDYAVLSIDDRYVQVIDERYRLIDLRQIRDDRLRHPSASDVRTQFDP